MAFLRYQMHLRQTHSAANHIINIGDHHFVWLETRKPDRDID